MVVTVDRMAGTGRRKPPYWQGYDVLRREQGFVCAHPDCDSPWLTWHHFDPPWRVEQHDRLEGIVGLCWEHAIEADGGAFTVEQIRGWKRQQPAVDVRGKFNWLRKEIRTRLGTNYVYSAGALVEVRDEPCIWFNRSPENYALLNLRMPTVGNDPRLEIRDNVFLVEPVAGMLLRTHVRGHRRIEVEYPGGDAATVEFFESAGSLEPTVVEVGLGVGGGTLDINQHEIRVSGLSMQSLRLRENHFARGVVVGLGQPASGLFRLFDVDVPDSVHLAAPYGYRGAYRQHIVLSELVEDGELSDRYFESCDVVGPITLAPQDGTWWLDSHFHDLATLDDLFVEITDNGDLPEGAVTIRRCIFRRCRLQWIRLALTASAIEEFGREIRPGHS